MIADDVAVGERNRLGLGIDAERAYDGFLQTATMRDGYEGVYLSSTGGIVLQLLTRDNSWQIISLR